MSIFSRFLINQILIVWPNFFFGGKPMTSRQHHHVKSSNIRIINIWNIYLKSGNFQNSVKTLILPPPGPHNPQEPDLTRDLHPPHSNRPVWSHWLAWTYNIYNYTATAPCYSPSTPYRTGVTFGSDELALPANTHLDDLRCCPECSTTPRPGCICTGTPQSCPSGAYTDVNSRVQKFEWKEGKWLQKEFRNGFLGVENGIYQSATIITAL